MQEFETAALDLLLDCFEQLVLADRHDNVNELLAGFYRRLFAC